jgi:hypothetical protein
MARISTGTILSASERRQSERGLRRLLFARQKFSEHRILAMTIGEFRDSLQAGQPPAGISPLLSAMWWDAKGNWSRAHEIAQDIETADGSLVHAYLHRKESDPDNAGCWYRRAGRQFSHQPIEEEWSEIVQGLLVNP